MMRIRGLAGFSVVLAASGYSVAAAQTPPSLAGLSPRGNQAYTRYELLEPGSGKFRIVYDISEAKAGATLFFNPIRKGSVASEETVTDRASGKPLRFTVVSGAQAQSSGYADADLTYDYIRVELSRPVPPDGGEARIRIEKTYFDPKSYSQTGSTIRFDRSLGIKRNAVVLPKGYVLTTCNYPSQVAEEADGRTRISFLNTTPADAPLKLEAQKASLTPPLAAKTPPALSERAAESRDIVYALGPPELHAFDLYHDYTEDRPGVGTYVNVVRTGSAASNPSAKNLDTGEALQEQLLRGDAITKAGISEPGLGPVGPDTEVVVFRFNPAPTGGSVRLRMTETYTDPERYTLKDGVLIFHRSFARPANAVVLPTGWALTGSTIPAVVSQTADGRERLDFENPRPDEVDVAITARKVPSP
jgi:hypothetical protein